MVSRIRRHIRKFLNKNKLLRLHLIIVVIWLIGASLLDRAPSHPQQSTKVRCEGEEQAALLNELYNQLRLFINFFKPSMKLIEKIHQGSKVKKRYLNSSTNTWRITC